jgi:Uma2 family endonuclease
MTAPHRSGMTAEDYDRAAQAYLASLPLEHFMEATPQATQREITVASFALLRQARGNVRYFNELLVQYFHEGNLRQVVPDNMLVVGELSDERRGSYATELEPFPIFWVLEYVSPNNKRKDYVDNFQKYEQELKVPYYLLFEPEAHSLHLYRHGGTGYVPCEANAEGRYPLPELELEVGLADGWARFWHRGELLPLPTELQGRLDEQAERIRELENQVGAQEAKLQERDRALQEREEQIQQRDQQLQDREEQIQQRDRQLEGLLASLRPLVEARARQAGRQDILERLPATTDGAVLTRWLAEMG